MTSGGDGGDRPKKTKHGLFVRPSVYPIPKTIPEGLTVPWLAAMELAKRDPYDSNLGDRNTKPPNGPPDAKIMMKWLKVNPLSWNIYCDIVSAISSGRLACDTHYYRGTNELDPFKSLVSKEGVGRFRRSKPRREIRDRTANPNAPSQSGATSHGITRPRGADIYVAVKAVYENAKENEIKPPNINELCSLVKAELPQERRNVTNTQIKKVASEIEFKNMRLKVGEKWRP